MVYLSRLLYAIIAEKNLQVLADLRPEYIEPQMEAAFQFVRTYHAKHRDFPSVLAVETDSGITPEQTTDKAQYLLSVVAKKWEEGIIQQAVVKAAKDKTTDAFTDALRLINTVKQRTDAQGYADTVDEREKAYEERKAQGGISYLPTGDSILDGVLGGYSATDYILVGGGEGMGKTWWLVSRAQDLNGIIHTIKTPAAKRPILFFSGEMDTSEIADRLDARGAGINHIRLIKGRLTAGEEQIKSKYLRRLKQQKALGRDNLVLFDKVTDITQIENYMALYNPAMVFVDGIHLFSKSFDWKDIMHTSVRFKQMARMYRIPILTTAHIKTGAGTTENVSVDDFAYFKGARDPDVAMVMFRDDMMALGSQVGLGIVKGRQGQSGTLIYTVDKDTSRQAITEVR